VFLALVALLAVGPTNARADTPAPPACEGLALETSGLGTLLTQLQDAVAAPDADIEADRLAYQGETLRFEGAVMLRSGELLLEMDTLERNPEQLMLTQVRLQRGDLELRASRVSLAPGSIHLTGFELLRLGTSLVKAAQADYDGAQLELQDAWLSPCPCAEGDASVVLTAQTVTIDSPEDPERRRAHFGTSPKLGLWGIGLPVWVENIESDGRSSGFLLPQLGYQSHRGLELLIPAFLRLGSAADLQPALGWATSIGPMVEARARLAGDRGTHGDVRAEGLYELEAERLDYEVSGELTVAFMTSARAFLLADLLAAPTLHEERRGVLAERAQRYGRNALALAWESDTATLAVGADLLQGRPRNTATEQGSQGGYAPFPDGLEDTHALPHLGFSTSALLGTLRFDFDAEYLRSRTFADTRFIDWGDYPRASLWNPVPALPSTGAFDGLMGENEVLADSELVGIDLIAELPLSLDGYAQVLLGLGVEQRHRVARREDGQSAFASETQLAAGAELSTSLFKRSPQRTHVLVPKLSWRGLLATFDEDRLGRETLVDLARGQLRDHTLTAELDSTWLSEEWRVTLAFENALHPDMDFENCEGCGWSGARLRVSNPASTLSFGLRGAVGWGDASPALDARFSVVDPDGWRAELWHVSSPARWWLAETSNTLLLSIPRGRLSHTLDEVMSASHLTGASLSRRGPGVNIGLLAATLWGDPLGLESQALLGYTSECQCWSVAATASRHASAPFWEALTTFTLRPGL